MKNRLFVSALLLFFYAGNGLSEYKLVERPQSQQSTKDCKNCTAAFCLVGLAYFAYFYFLYEKSLTH